MKHLENPATAGPHRRRGWIVVESVISLALMAVLLSGLSVALADTRTFNSIMLARRHCVAAAQAQLDSVAARGQPIDQTRVAGLWDRVETEVAYSPGEGDWSGLTLVTTTASTVAGGRNVSVSLSRYIIRKEPP